MGELLYYKHLSAVKKNPVETLFFSGHVIDPQVTKIIYVCIVST